ncbi:hypothetical protein HKB23_00225 [Vibrio parahaemolyticus]|nr:hypothetical protein [Vibrio parahaemolyticus]
MEESSGLFSLFVPSKRSIPKIKIRTRQNQNLRNQKIMVAIDTWERNSRYPSGNYLQRFCT